MLVSAINEWYQDCSSEELYSSQLPNAPYYSHKNSTTSKPITSELNNQTVDVFGSADHENFPLHILSLNLWRIEQSTLS